MLFKSSGLNVNDKYIFETLLIAKGNIFETLLLAKGNIFETLFIANGNIFISKLYSYSLNKAC